MKIRLGFVSNSSSTSFCICGISVYGKEAKDLFKIEDIDELWNLQCEDSDGKNVVECYSQDDCLYYIGVDIDHMKEDETKAQFKERVRGYLYKLTGKEDIKCGFLTDGWYDG